MTHVEVSCLCGKARADVHLTGNVPVKSVLCHQTQCRHNLGALCHSALRIEDRPEGVDLLKAYVVDESLSRYFCDVCGSHMFEHEGEWKVQSGVVERIHSEQVSNALEDIVGHRHAHETLDGGLSLCFSGTYGVPTKRDMQEIESSSSITTHDPASGSTKTAGIMDNPTQLHASCACGGVQFFLTRPNDQSRQCSSPWPDLMVPYHAQSSSENPTDRKWWIGEENKWRAGTCACRSCRLALGSPIQAWTFVSKSNLFNADGSPLSYNVGTLRSFESSPGATREFCRTCGATVFWHNQERPGVVDVSVGLLRAPEGALARTWLHWWTNRVSFAEDALDKLLIARLRTGLGSIRQGRSA